MEILKDIGIAGFLFFLIKGLLWILLFALVYFGWIGKEKAQRIKSKLSFWKRKKSSWSRVFKLLVNMNPLSLFYIPPVIHIPPTEIIIPEGNVHESFFKTTIRASPPATRDSATGYKMNTVNIYILYTVQMPLKHQFKIIASEKADYFLRIENYQRWVIR